MSRNTELAGNAKKIFGEIIMISFTTILKNLFKDEVSSSTKIMVIMIGISLMMVSFGFMVAMLVAVLGVETFIHAAGTITLLIALAWFFNFLKGL